MKEEIITLQQHRQKTVEDICKLFKYNNRVCCVRYTGYGKTYFVIRELLFRFSNRQFLVLVPRISLVTQYTNMFNDINNVQIITYQSLLTEEYKQILYSNTDYIICDECHHLSNNVWGYNVQQLIEGVDNVKVLGLTATPLRSDSIDVRTSFFNNVCVEDFNLLDGIKNRICA